MWNIPSFLAMVLCLLICTTGSAPSPLHAMQDPEPDLAREIQNARSLVADPLPDAKIRARIAGQVNGTPILLGQVLEEAVWLYAAPIIEVLANQRAMSLEAARRGLRTGDRAFLDAVRAFWKQNGHGQDLRDTLSAQRLTWPRFERLMRLNALVAAMIQADGGDPTDTGADNPKGRAWARSILEKSEIQTDPARLERGVYARVEASWPLRDLLAHHLSGRTPLRMLDTTDDGRTIRFDLTLPDGEHATVEMDNHQISKLTADGIQPGTLLLSEVFPAWKARAFEIRPPSPEEPDMVHVGPVRGAGPSYRFGNRTVRARSDVRENDLLAARLPDLKLSHLDEALQSRARWIAFMQAMKQRNLTVSEKRVALRIARERARYRDQPFSWDRAIQLVGRNVYLETRRFRVADGVDQILGTDATDDVLRAYYEAHIDHFGQATVVASHILISEADPKTGRVDFDSARKKINEVYDKLKNGAAFVDMVQTYSQDPVSRTRGGDVGMFTLVSAYDEEFCGLAFALKENEISPPVRTRQGYHIIYCRQRTQPDREAHPYEDLKDVVRD